MIISTKLFDIYINELTVKIVKTNLQSNNYNYSTKFINLESDNLYEILYDTNLINDAIYNCLIKLINVLCSNDNKNTKTGYSTLIDNDKKLINNTHDTFTFNNEIELTEFITIIEICDDSINNETETDIFINYYEVLFNELNELIKKKSNNNEINFTLYKYGDVTLLNYFDMRNGFNWSMFINLIIECLNSKNIDNVFNPRPAYINKFKNFNHIFTISTIIDAINYFNTIINNFVTSRNKDMNGPIDKDKRNIFTNLEFYIYQYDPIAYDIIITALNNFNMYNLSIINNSELGLNNSNDITIYKVESNDIELEQKFNNRIKQFDNNINFCGYHGSEITNWYSILFNGLYTPKATNYLMANANAYGKGVYLSNSFNFSLSYCKNSNYKIMGVFQTYNDFETYKKASNIYVVPDSKDLYLRYLIYFKQCQNPINLDNYFINKQHYNNHSSTIINKRANRRIINEIRNLHKYSDVKNNNYDIYYHLEINEDNMQIFKMSLDISNFDDTSSLYSNFIKYGIKTIDFEFRLPDEYPFKPPFIRIISPRFKYMTGHITIGGSICMEILTNQLWVPSLMLNKVVLMIIQNMISGGAELDNKKYKIPYTYDEAMSAYKRMLVSHSEWK